MNEMSKAVLRWKSEGVFERYIRGRVLDVGCGPDKITPEADGWDQDDGDAQKLVGVPDASYDSVVSAHALEHMRDPHEALFNWWRVLKPGGYLVALVPDQDLYEQGVCPSLLNSDHKFSFTISKDTSWCPRSVNVLDLLNRLPNRRVVSVRTIDTGYGYTLAADPTQYVDQTLTGAEAAIEFVVQKMGPGVGHRLRSGLKTLMVCSQCKRNSLMLTGVTEAGKVEVRCGDCGLLGEL